MSYHQVDFEVNGKSVTMDTGKWARQAHGSVVYRTGSLVLLATVCAEKEAKEGQDFFPLTVDYREKVYSVGRIPGGYIKRENRPAEHETLISRIIDRPIRPLFPEGYLAEVQLLLTVLSADPGSTIEGHAITAASAAMMVSDIPFHGPIAGVVVGRINGEFIADPTVDQLKEGDLELVVAGSADAITMIEGGAKEYERHEIIEAVAFAHEAIKSKLAPQIELAEKVGVKKREVSLHVISSELKEVVSSFAFEKMKSANENTDKVQREEDINAVYKETVEHLKKEYEAKQNPDFEKDKRDIKNYLHEIEAEVVRSKLFHEGTRSDGRKPDQIRDITVELDVLPGVHGSAVFTRGQTQSLGVVTLGTANDFQRYENLSGQQSKHFMLHYNFPPYSTGEVKRMAGPGRREIGHGNLAERALRYVVPDREAFPYTVRVVSEILESNGSSSMASVCSGSLSMMTAGVPLTRPVSGIAMGLIMNQDGDYRILSDIAGIEDHFGDMDFKVAGTEKGITAFQLDIKVNGISLEILDKAIEQAEKGRAHILSIMNEAIFQSRDSVPQNAPRISTLQIDPDRIGELIGPGGKVIRAIIEKSGADINVEDNGTVTIASSSGEANDIARGMIDNIFNEIEVGTVYMGNVKRVADFGAIIEISPGKEGLMHISKMSNERVSDVHSIVKEGDKVECKVIDVDRNGRIDLAHKDFDISTMGPGGGGRPPRRGPGGGGGRGGRDGGGRGPRR